MRAAGLTSRLVRAASYAPAVRLYRPLGRAVPNVRRGTTISLRACSSTHHPTVTICSVDRVDWNDRVGLQAAWTNEEKGWHVDVEWKQTPYGAGLFAKQDVPCGTVLRVGVNGRNLLQLQSAEEIELFCTQGSTTATPVPALVSYVSDYMYGFDPNDTSGSGAGGGAGSSGAEPPLEMWYGIWVPGNGLNHGTEPNTVYRTAPDGIAAGINLVALTDIKSGEELLDDYRRHGAPPTWALTWAQKYGVSMNFAGCNDFV